MPEVPVVEDLSKPSKEQEYSLTPLDQEKMRKASIVLLRKFFEDYPDKLPDAIILPDTSARPLAYLLKPVLERASKKRGVTLPKIYFFNYVEIPEKREIRKEIEFGKIRPVRSLPLNEVERSNQLIAQAEKVFATRAQQIMKDLRRQGIENPEIAIFDDHVTAALRTSKGITRAFGRHNNIPLYSFFSDSPEDRFRFNDIKVRTGDDLREIPYKGDVKGIGVTKDLSQAELMSSPINPPYIKAMTALRSDLSKVGQEVASALNL